MLPWKGEGSVLRQHSGWCGECPRQLKHTGLQPSLRAQDGSFSSPWASPAAAGALPFGLRKLSGAGRWLLKLWPLNRSRSTPWEPTRSARPGTRVRNPRRGLHWSSSFWGCQSTPQGVIWPASKSQMLPGVTWEGSLSLGLNKQNTRG